MHPREYILEVKSGALIAVYVLLGLFALVSFVLHAFLFQMRQHPVIRQSSYALLQIMLAGSLLFYVTLLVGMQPASIAVCISSQFLFSLAFTMFYVSMLMKSYVERTSEHGYIKHGGCE